MRNTPVFSILTPTYNCAKFIIRSYECLLSQTNQNWEWVIINDGSTDDTESVFSIINDERVKIHSYEKNKGRGYARNLGLSYCEGDIIVVWDIDDIYLPNRLEYIYQAIKIDNYDFFVSQALVVDNEFNFKGVRGFYENKLYKSFVHPTLAFKRSISNVINYDKNMKAGEDLYIMILLSNNYKGYYLDKNLMLYFEDREINLYKTIQMHDSHSISINRIIGERLLNIKLKDKAIIYTTMILKKIALSLFLIKPSLYLKTVKYRRIQNSNKMDGLNEILGLITKYKEKYI
ncbi:MAG: glycosyltransferase family 2 protein [Lutibacter sp.]|nr:glycosyltransferase family 2 protein [Lutibacter sp.]